jgi:flavin reductase (DIM6/NTAB) family NADH-FMN oxidoreductase RutF
MSNVIRSIMRTFPLGVVIITTKWSDNLVGMTVNTFNSLSLNPPLVMFSADKTKGNEIPFKDSKGFIVNFVDDKKLLDIFASKPVRERFIGINFSETEFGPILSKSYAFIGAKKYTTYDIGDHTIIIGEVIDGKFTRNDFEPLVYANREYHKINLF